MTKTATVYWTDLCGLDCEMTFPQDQSSALGYLVAYLASQNMPCRVDVTTTK